MINGFSSSKRRSIKLSTAIQCLSRSDFIFLLCSALQLALTRRLLERLNLTIYQYATAHQSSEVVSTLNIAMVYHATFERLLSSALNCEKKCSAEN